MCWKPETRKTTNLYRPALSTVPKPARNIQKKSCSTLCLSSSGFEEHKLSTLVKQGLLNQLKQMVLCPEAVRQSRKMILVLSSFISISAKARREPLKPLLFRSSIYSSLTVLQLFSIRDVCRGNILVPFLHWTFPSKHASFYAQSNFA